jgi:fructose-1,6-bisphosphatase/inositol monophosphatase family enzyme
VAARVILPRFRNLAAGDVAHKKRNPRDLVTIADIEAERALEHRLGALVPGSVFVGEEAAEAQPGILSMLAGGDPVWLLDPVDGTSNFAEGHACFAVIVGFCMDGEAKAGFILDPLADAVLWAMAGQGAWVATGAEQRRVTVVHHRPLSAMRGSLTHRSAERLALSLAASGQGSAPSATRYGSVGREYMDLARGVLDFASYARLKPWDHAAGVLIHREAGGFSALRSNGSPYRPAPCIVEDTLLLAPDEVTWHRLHTLLG